MPPTATVGHGVLNQVYHNGTGSRDLLPLWCMTGIAMRSTATVGHGMLNQSYHNGTVSRDLLPLWYSAGIAMRSTAAVGHGMPNQAYHNGTESRDLLPLRMEVVTVGCPRGCCRRCAACDGLPHWQRFPRFAAVVVQCGNRNAAHSDCRAWCAESVIPQRHRIPRFAAVADGGVGGRVPGGWGCIEEGSD